MVSRQQEYFLEPVASYTIQDYIQYFYNTVPVDLQAQPPSKMCGLIKYKINAFGIDKALFIADLCAQTCKENNKIFNFNQFDDYSIIADEHLESIKGNFSNTEDYYTLKQRSIVFDV